MLLSQKSYRGVTNAVSVAATSVTGEETEVTGRVER